MDGALAAEWIALELRPGGIPKIKVYLNPSASGEERPPGLTSRAAGMLLSPGATYQRLLRTPVWLDGLF